MNINDKILQDYVDGTLDEETRRKVDSELEDNPQLQREVEAYRTARRAVEITSLKKDLDGLFEESSHFKQQEKGIPRRYWALAASLLILIGLGTVLWWQLNTQPHVKLYADFYQADRGLPSRMGGEEHLAPWEDPMVDYKRSQYGEAALGFSNALKEHPANDTVLLYLGLSEMELGRLEQAQHHLKSVKSASPQMYQKAQWYRALLLLKNKQINQSRDLLLKIRAQDDHPYSEKADQLLLQIEKQ